MERVCGASTDAGGGAPSGALAHWSGAAAPAAEPLKRKTNRVLFPVTTSIFAAVLALVYVVLAGWVMAGRTTKHTLEGDGGDPELQKRVRAHGNFGEYVPLALIVIGLYEGGGGSHGLVLALLWALLIGRLLHPVGLFARPNTVPMFACRGGGMLLTLLSIAVGAVALIVAHA